MAWIKIVIIHFAEQNMKKTGMVLILCSLILNLLLPITITARGENTTPETTGEAIMVTAMVNAQIDITSTSAVLLEGSTGEIIYEKNKDEKLKPASITKVMTLLLIFEALDSGQIKLMDQVSISEHAASMGGSQVYLEPYEMQNVDTLIKCISVVSANDASVAMAEYISGSEEEFVASMNARAKELGMNNTCFLNCCGLDIDGHYSTAYDVALMSRELITKHPEISTYSTIWMDTFIHTTKKGQSEFGLSNTNKLIKTYKGITGLKTGSTSLAKYCLSATAKRDNMDLIAVVMAAPSTKIRFQEAAKLLNYGFANCSIFTDDNTDIPLEPVKVVKGVSDTVKGKVGTFSYLCLKGKNSAEITKDISLSEELIAPIMENDKIGEITYYYNGQKIGSMDILASESINKTNFKHCVGKLLKKYFLSKK